MSKRSVVYSIVLASSLAILPVPALAISQLTVSSQGDGVFVVTGKLENVGAMQLNLSYDSTTLSNPRVVLGSLTSSMMNASNPASNPIRIAAVGIKSINGTGPVAVITFDRNGSSPGVVTGLTGTLLDATGRHLSMAQPQIYNPVAVASTDSGSGFTGTTTTGGSGAGSGTTETGRTTTAATGTPYVVGGSVTLPSDPLAQTEKRETQTAQVAQDATERQMASELQQGAAEAAPQQQPAPQPTESQAPAQQPKNAVAEATLAVQPVQSVVDKFRLFSGERSVGNLTALFNGRGAATFTQSPDIALADGKTTVKVIISNVSGEKAPTFTFYFARSVSVRSIGDGEWEVVVKPEKGAVTASIVMNANGTAQEIPLTVAPKAETTLSKSGTPESDFQLFLNDRGTASAPKYDLNGDGKRDYLDDYIYTANYLVKNGSAQVKADGKSQQKVSTGQNQ